MKSSLRIGVAILFITGAVIGIYGFARLSSHTVQATDGKIPVVAAENFWGNIASQLGGQYVSVRSIVTDPNVDPHLYESSAQDASSLAQARLIISNGLGYDDFIDRLSQASSVTAEHLKVSDVLKINGDNPNPHLWYDIPRIPEVASAITKAYVKLDPGHRSTYNANLAKFVSSLTPLLDAINAIRQQSGGAPVAYTERVAGYVLQNCGLRVVSPSSFAQAIEDGNDPSAADTRAMDELFTNRQVRALVYNSQVTSSVTKAVQSAALTKYIPIVGFTETLPKNEKNYQSWQLHQLQVLQKAVK